MRLTHKCPYCNKTTDITSEQYVEAMHLYIYKYSCGHSEVREKLVLQDNTFSNFDGTKEAYPFQREGISFCERANFQCMIADSMGLGKTIQAILAVKNAQLFPCLVIVRSSTIYQWTREIQDWYSPDGMSVFPISGSRTLMVSGFKFYVISMDTMGRNGTWKKLAALNFKSIVVDECHSFKDDSAKRTQALTEFVKATNPKRIFLSGTPIKNRAGEFFVPLNLIAPDRFTSRTRFQREWLITNEKGQYTRIAPWKLERFHETVGKFIIRREKEDVLKNLPPMTPDYQFVSTEDESMKEMYNSELDLFQNYLENGDKIDAMGILGWLANLRRITAMAKIPLAGQWISDFQESSNEKLAVGMHHHAVRDSLKVFFPTAISLSGEDSAVEKDKIVSRFQTPECPLLIINIGSGGLGLNLQFCHNALILERYWNAADEEQFIGRFHRNGQTEPVSVTYLMLQGSIDEWFHELVCEKKKIFGETVNSWNLTSDESSLKDLAKKTIANRL
jgi:SWI/SNF-related matrix-associated actin-dependent regulator of chromatin subfamily A-like protein 1